MGRFLNINHPVIQQHLIHDVLACQERSWSVEKIARHLYYSDRMRGCRRGHLTSFQERVRSILLEHGDPIWRYRLRRRAPFQLSSDLMLDILAKKLDKHDIDEEDLSSIDEDDPDLDGYIEQEEEEDLEFVRLCFDPANNVKPQIDSDTDSDADADAVADAVAADADAAVADAADAAVADAADAAVADILLQGKDAQSPMLFKDLVGMDAVAVLKAAFFNVPFKMSRILLHGPPGCAITNLAHSIAYETPHVSFYQSSASGASKDELFELFSKASTTTPSIVFIHDIDAVRLLDALMSMDMFHRPGSLLVIGATTRRHAIDPALKSFGQFDCEIALAIPDENNPRVHILSVLAREMEKLSITIPADFQARDEFNGAYIVREDLYSRPQLELRLKRCQWQM